MFIIVRPDLSKRALAVREIDPAVLPLYLARRDFHAFMPSGQTFTERANADRAARRLAARLGWEVVLDDAGAAETAAKENALRAAIATAVREDYVTEDGKRVMLSLDLLHRLGYVSDEMKEAVEADFKKRNTLPNLSETT